MDPHETSTTAGDLLAGRAAAHARDFDGRGIPVRPRLRAAIVSCMDSRIALYRLFGLAVGDAHIIRNAGGIVTDDVIRSLVISQRKLGTDEVLIVQHTDCGLATFRDETLSAELEAAAGRRPDWSAGTFTDLDASVRRSVALVASSPFIPSRDAVRGFVYDVVTGGLREVA